MFSTKSFFAALLCLAITAANVTYAQQTVDKKKFFRDSSVINATLTLNIKKLMAKKAKEGYLFPASFSCKLNDSLEINDHINAEVRGHFRRSYCYVPPLKLIFKNDHANAFYHLKELKLVSNCMPTNDDDQNLLKEYLIYKFYNLITERSFRVRLLNLSIRDSSGKRTPITEHAFLLEDVRELAKRNATDDWTERNFNTEATDRRQMTMVAFFEYMIGNTDWSIPKSHNVKLLHSNVDSLSRPFVVPYDFDFSGLVNTNYSFPSEKLAIESVQQRLYRGYVRTPDEIREMIGIFNDLKPKMYATINNFSLLQNATKKDMIRYLDQFYETINDPEAVKETFITNAKQR